jgi:uncharacterized protein (TIGR02145 family)
MRYFGNIYNYYAISDNRGLCPVGWRIPTSADWDELILYAESLSPIGNAGNHLSDSNNLHCL